MAIAAPENLNNLYSLYRLVGKNVKNARLLTFERYTIIHVKDSAWPNMAFEVDGERLDKEVVESLATEMRFLGVMPSVVLYQENVQVSVLKASGFLPLDQWVGMSYDGIGDVGADISSGNGVAGLMEGPGDIDLWTEVVAETLFDHRPLDRSVFRELQSAATEFVGIKIDGELAGTAMIYFDEGNVAGIYMVGVKEKFRGKGLGKQIIRYCLTSIKRRGIGKCYLQSTRMGMKLYMSLNFKESDKYLIFCKIK